MFVSQNGKDILVRTHAVRVKLMTCKFFILKLIIYTTLSIMYSLDIFYMVVFIVHAGN